MRYGPALIIALALLATPLVWFAAAPYLSSQGSSIDPAAMRAEVSALRSQIRRLSERVERLERRPQRSMAPTAPDVAPALPDNIADTLRDAFAQVVLIANRRNANDGLTAPGPAFLKQMFGLPREDLTDECQPITNPQLKAMLRLEDVGPFQVRMLAPALTSLRRIFANVEQFEPELLARLRSAGSLCVRRIRGSEEGVSSHAYGLALDINVDGVLDTLGDGKTQLGLTLLADFFRQEGWIWGAGFGREDSMHFEVSREKLVEWRQQGLI
ncbi:MAG: M15 family metallopeptidase [Pseudomonadota bacterium]